jgi:hypothetical protein
MHTTRHRHSFTRALCAATVLLLAAGAQSQNLFVSNIGSGLPGAGSIIVFKGGGRSTFATGLSLPIGLAFDDGGNLFEADQQSGNLYRFTPGGVRSTFATGLYEPQGLAFDDADNLFVTDAGSGAIYEYAPGGTRSTFATGITINGPGITFQVPEPSGLALLACAVVSVLLARNPVRRMKEAEVRR